VYEVQPRSEDDVNFLHSLVDNEDFDFWSLRKAVGVTSTVAVNPNSQSWFENSLNDREIPFTVTIEDLERFENEYKANFISFHSIYIHTTAHWLMNVNLN
jgi:hypothetical protein